MSTLKTNSVQIGQSATAANNFVLTVPAVPDGSMKLARGNVGATTQDVLTVDASGALSGVAPTTGDSSAKLATTGFVNASSLGLGQTWQNVLGSRALNTTYYNTTGKPIMVMATAQCGTTEISGLYIYLDGTGITTSSAANGQSGVSFVVSPGSAYVIGINSGAPTLTEWIELR